TESIDHLGCTFDGQSHIHHQAFFSLWVGVRLLYTLYFAYTEVSGCDGAPVVAVLSRRWYQGQYRALRKDGRAFFADGEESRRSRTCFDQVQTGRIPAGSDRREIYGYRIRCDRVGDVCGDRRKQMRGYGSPAGYYRRFLHVGRKELCHYRPAQEKGLPARRLGGDQGQESRSGKKAD